MTAPHPPAPPGALRPWRPALADPDRFDAPPEPTPVDGDTLVMEAELEPPEAQALFRALDRAGLAPRVRAPEPRCAGLAWYDRLPRIRSLAVIAVVDGRTCAPEAVAVPEGGLRAPRPEAVRVVLRIAHPAGRDTMRTLPADLALAGPPGPWAGAARALVTPDSDLTPEALAALLRAAFFCPCGGGADRQRRRFDEDALRAALLLLASDDEARRDALAEAVARDLLWLCPTDRQAVITVCAGRVSVAFGAPVHPSLTKEDCS